MKLRADIRRRQRKAAKTRRPLTLTEVRRINAQRRLPGDHPSVDKDFPNITELEDGRYFIAAFERTGTFPYLHRKLRIHPGLESSLPLELLLAGRLIAAWTQKSARLSDVCAAINGFDSELLHEHHLCDRVELNLVTYTIVCNQITRLDDALREGWTDPVDGTKCNLDWFCHRLLAASIPIEVIEKIRTVVIDGTMCETWAVPQDFTPEAEVRAKQRKLASSGELSLPKPSTAEIGEVGADGRQNRTKDPRARPIHIAATAKRSARKGVGFETIIVGVGRHATFQGDPRYVSFGDPLQPYITHVSTVPGLSGIALAGADALDWSCKIAYNTEVVLGDRGFSRVPPFVRAQHKAGRRMVNDYPIDVASRCRQVIVNRSKTRTASLLEHVGTFLPPWTPRYYHQPPETLKEMLASQGLSLPPGVEDRPLTKEETTEWHNERAKLRMSVNRPLACGGAELECPQCAGRVITQLKTRNRKVKVSKSALRITADVGHLGNIQYCCDGLLSVGVELLDRFQEIPHGTTAWQQRYNRRPQIENINGMVKDKGGFSDGWCRSFRDGTRATSTIIAAFAHNLRLARPETIHSTNGSSPAANAETVAPGNVPAESPGGAAADRAPP